MIGRAASPKRKRGSSSLHKINCGITVFGGLQDNISRAELEQWRLHGDYFQLHMFEGGHFFIDQHFKEMAAIINQTSSYLNASMSLLQMDGHRIKQHYIP